MDLTREEYREECQPPAPLYHSTLPRKRQRVFGKGRNGRVKQYSPEEIYLFIVRRIGSTLNYEV